MRILLVTGGARSGKSRYAVEEARRIGGEHVSFIATAEARDEDMARRIRRHRAQRPRAWETVEAPRRSGEALKRARHPTVVLDCLTLLVSNAVLEAADSEEAAQAAARAEVTDLLKEAARREGTLIAVTNEVGMGIVPEAPVARWFRDAQGEANRHAAERADAVVLLVAGIPLSLK